MTTMTESGAKNLLTFYDVQVDAIDRIPKN